MAVNLCPQILLDTESTNVLYLLMHKACQQQQFWTIIFLYIINQDTKNDNCWLISYNSSLPFKKHKKFKMDAIYSR